MRPYSKPKRRRREQQPPVAQIPAVFEIDNGQRNCDDERRAENMQEDYRDIGELYPGLIGLTMPQKIFNYRLSRACKVIENVFGILVSKWTILKGSINCKLKTAESNVMVIICLHYFILVSDSNIPPAQRMYQNIGLVDGHGPNGELLQNGAWRGQVPYEVMLERVGRLGANNPARVAITQRDKLRDYSFTEDGEVQWQYDYALRNVPIIRPPI